MKKIGRPSKNTEQVTVRLLVNTIEAIDAARRSEDDLPSRPEMIRRMIDDWLDRHAEENPKKVE
ncbi:ribbon-helix-helix protein, CopG family [Sulfitobacter pontiacus]|uniref:ribbon-helix-helix protein, CopG family n=1 Tax=Sulfitobacter pontiacus TaxID=60137 RepID=UPI0026161B6E|nr:ribbon-helix-helix protein, CopG family [uncultured Sulfitobacter sp.]